MAHLIPDCCRQSVSHALFMGIGVLQPPLSAMKFDSRSPRSDNLGQGRGRFHLLETPGEADSSGCARSPLPVVRPGFPMTGGSSLPGGAETPIRSEIFRMTQIGMMNLDMVRGKVDLY